MTIPLRTARRLAMLGAVLLWSMSAACRSITAPDERFLVLEVAEQQVPCVGSGPRQCLQVRQRADAPWALFYESIEGFTFEPGFRYVLSVARRSVPNPPADGSSVAYRLLRVVARTPAP